IVLMPFTTSLIGEYSQFYEADLIFGINVSLSIIFFLLMFNYASRMGFLEDHVEKAKKHTYQTFVTMIVITVIATATAYLHFHWAILIYLALPILSTARVLYHKSNT
ncbi:MAG: hypothetical protein ACRC1M_08000, partial [Methanobacteriaceae archaeon]